MDFFDTPVTPLERMQARVVITRADGSEVTYTGDLQSFQVEHGLLARPQITLDFNTLARLTRGPSPERAEEAK